MQFLGKHPASAARTLSSLAYGWWKLCLLLAVLATLVHMFLAAVHGGVNAAISSLTTWDDVGALSAQNPLIFWSAALFLAISALSGFVLESIGWLRTLRTISRSFATPIVTSLVDPLQLADTSTVEVEALMTWRPKTLGRSPVVPLDIGEIIYDPPCQDVAAALQVALNNSLQDPQRAVRALHAHGTTTPIPILLEALKNQSVEVRAKAAVILGRLGDQAPIDELANMLANHDLDRSWRLAALWALGNLGACAPLGSIIDASRDDSLVLQIAAEQILEQMGGYAPTYLISRQAGAQH
jgi:hypothetical protein